MIYINQPTNIVPFNSNCCTVPLITYITVQFCKSCFVVNSYTVPLINYINCQALCIAGYSNYHTVLIINYIKSVVIFSGKTSIIILY